MTESETVATYRTYVEAAALRRPGSCDAIREALAITYGVRRLVLFEDQHRHLVSIVVEGGDRLDLEHVLDMELPLVVAHELTVWRAPWWWRAWCWLRRKVVTRTAR